jgi:hypothetical protein
VHAYTLVDAHAGYRITRGGRVHSFALRNDNILDVLYRDAASRVRDFAPNPGRNISPRTDRGMFDVHPVGDPLLFEIPDSVLGRDMAVMSRKEVAEHPCRDNSHIRTHFS